MWKTQFHHFDQENVDIEACKYVMSKEKNVTEEP